MKACRDCGTLKPLTQYYRHPQMADGHLNKCKPCVKGRVKRHRMAHLEEIQKYDRYRSSLPKRRAAAKRRRQTATEEQKKCSRRAKRAWARRNEHKRRAHRLLREALCKGAVIQGVCGCGRLDTQAHHDDYSKPLDVIWLCSDCHGKRHRMLNARRRSRRAPF